MEKLSRQRYGLFLEYNQIEGREKYLIFRDDAPDIFVHFVEDVHIKHFFCSYPNQWIYEEINQAFSDLEDVDNDLEELTIEADVYDSDLYKWFGNSFADEFCNEALAAGICGELNNIMSIIAMGQYLARRRIYEAVHDFIEEGDDE